jgi:hypothetical protein
MGVELWPHRRCMSVEREPRLMWVLQPSMNPVLRLVSILLTALLASCALTVTPSEATNRATSSPPMVTLEAATPPPHSPLPTPVDWATLARALQLPRLASGAPCPRSSEHQVSKAFGIALGDGPVYPVGFADGVLSVVAEGGAYRQKVLWVSASSYQGPVLIRGARLDGPGLVQFAVGESEPTEDFRLLDPGASSPEEEPGWREWPSYTEVPQFGCYAYQVDGTSFSTVVVFEVQY